tara:strand:- start:13515 stop:14612 length:1098 start_codon:yes stop_codon:yes gene_type:complete
MNVGEITRYLEQIAPLSFQEGYDNSGLLVGQSDWEVNGVLISLDCTPEIVEEAVAKGVNLIISHHPIVFKGLKKINGSNYVERTVIQAIKNDVALYAIHTNLDNVYQHGVNTMIAEKLGLNNLRILAPKPDLLYKLVTFVPDDHLYKVREALSNAGAGKIGNYSDCTFSSKGEGTFKAGNETNPFVGKKGEVHFEPETRLEVVVPQHLKRKVEGALIETHPYEEVAYDWYQMKNKHQQVGSGMIGELEKEIETVEFLNFLKTTMRAGCVRHTSIIKDRVKTIAVCGGSGSFLTKVAIAQKADVYVTADVKYHEFFDADGHLVIADIGHFESEQFTIELIERLLREKFSTFAIHLTEVNTNPINYL